MYKEDGIKYLTYAEAEKVIPVSKRTLQRYIKQGKLEVIHINTRTYIAEPSLKALITR